MAVLAAASAALSNLLQREVEEGRRFGVSFFFLFFFHQALVTPRLSCAFTVCGKSHFF